MSVIKIIKVSEKEIKDLITEIIVPIFDDVQGLTIEFRQYFVDSEE